MLSLESLRDVNCQQKRNWRQVCLQVFSVQHRCDPPTAKAAWALHTVMCKKQQSGGRHRVRKCDVLLMPTITVARQSARQ